MLLMLCILKYINIRNLVQEHLTNSPVALKPLSMKLNGIIDAAVMGGTAMYERAFFSGKLMSLSLSTYPVPHLAFWHILSDNRVPFMLGWLLRIQCKLFLKFSHNQ